MGEEYANSARCIRQIHRVNRNSKLGSELGAKRLRFAKDNLEKIAKADGLVLAIRAE